jgi:hypothetical protein
LQLALDCYLLRLELNQNHKKHMKTKHRTRSRLLMGTDEEIGLDLDGISAIAHKVRRIRADRNVFCRGINIKPPTFIVNGVDIRD